MRLPGWLPLSMPGLAEIRCFSFSDTSNAESGRRFFSFFQWESLTIEFRCYTLSGMKDDKQQLIFNIVGAFKRTMKLERELEKKPRDYGTGEKLYSSEIHLIEAIGVSGELSVTDAADYFGITKGAVSQTLKKIENKGLVKKEKDPANSSRYVLGLTTKGKAAFYSHMHWHEKIDGGFREAFFGFEVEQLEFIHDFLKLFETFLQNRLRSEDRLS